MANGKWQMANISNEKNGYKMRQTKSQKVKGKIWFQFSYMYQILSFITLQCRILSGKVVTLVVLVNLI